MISQAPPPGATCQYLGRHIHTTRNAHLKQHNIISGTSVSNLPYVKKNKDIDLHTKLFSIFREHYVHNQ